MWPFRRTTARQKEIRRSRAERGLAWYRRAAARLRVEPALFLLGCAGVAAIIVARGEDPLELRVGQRVPRAIASRVAFSREDEQQTQVLRMRAHDNAPEYYILDASLLQDIRGRLTSALRVAREQAGDVDKLRQKAPEIKRELKIDFDEAGLVEIARLAGLPDAAAYQDAVDRAVLILRAQPLVEAKGERRRTGVNAVLVESEPSGERPVPADHLLFANSAEHMAQVAALAAARFDPPLRETVSRSLLLILEGTAERAAKPLYRYDEGRSTRAATEAEESVPKQYVEYAVGTRLADAGETSRDELELLQDEHRYYQAQCAFDPVLRGVTRRATVASALIAVLLVFSLGGYVLAVHQRSLGTVRRRYTITITLLLLLLLARSLYLQTPVAHLAVGLFAFAVGLLAITAAGRGPAYAAAGLLALLTALATRQGVGFVAILVTVGLVLFFGLRDVRNRGKITAVGVVAALAALGMTVLTGLVDGQSLTFVLWRQALWAALTTLGAAFLIEGLLPGIERVFRITTNMTLLEWCDPNKPLLRLMAAEAPGTYNHSLLVGALADAAAEAIGANGLLTRTGAYYHDVGKINKPEYFVENQALGVGSRHDRLSPAMSHLIIIGHVKDGIAMAKEYGLPASLHPFIPEHHGTCVVEYFYHAASRARRPGDPEISEQEFRYPGPKPQSRETAIVMLCDAVEGAIRAMPEPTPGRIEDTVDRMVQKRLMDGQFDECDLTFRELEIIRKSLVKTLSSIYHGRITYPSEEVGEETAGEPPAASRSAS